MIDRKERLKQIPCQRCLGCEGEDRLSVTDIQMRESIAFRLKSSIKSINISIG